MAARGPNEDPRVCYVCEPIKPCQKSLVGHLSVHLLGQLSIHSTASVGGFRSEAPVMEEGIGSRGSIFWHILWYILMRIPL